jgi:hypothetical protein
METVTASAHATSPPLAPPTAPVTLPAVWRSGKLLVTARQVHLNDRCIKCNAFVGEKRIKRTHFWHHPALFLTVFAGFLVYVIIALVLRKKAVVYLGLCSRHRRQRWMHIGISWAIVLAGSGLVIASAVQESIGLFLVAFLIFFGGLAYTVITVPLLKPTQIDDSWGWFKGCSMEYLAAYPEWPYRR